MLMDLGVGYLFGRFEMYEIVRGGGGGRSEMS